MNYGKGFLDLEQQADRLIERGLQADREELISRLRVVNYYRLSGYLYPFRERDSSGARLDTFSPGSTSEQAWRRYTFDRGLRLVLLDAIERIEVAARTRLVYRFAERHGPFGHLDQANLPNFLPTTDQFAAWKQRLSADKRRASEAKNPSILHFESKYGDEHPNLPLWVACELMTCETTLTFPWGMDRAIVKTVAMDFGFPDDHFISWLKAIFVLRNACAHHARVWNRRGGVSACVPGNKNKNPAWYCQPRFAPDRIGHSLCVCHQWLRKITCASAWRERLFDLFDEYPDIPLGEMGIPETWREHELWKT
jgi:abortive infection bacteriophage resistance protein